MIESERNKRTGKKEPTNKPKKRSKKTACIQTAHEKRTEEYREAGHYTGLEDRLSYFFSDSIQQTKVQDKAQFPAKYSSS